VLKITEAVICWRKISAPTDNAECVEVAAKNAVRMRDSKNPKGAVVNISLDDWAQPSSRATLSCRALHLSEFLITTE